MHHISASSYNSTSLPLFPPLQRALARLRHPALSAGRSPRAQPHSPAGLRPASGSRPAGPSGCLRWHAPPVIHEEGIMHNTSQQAAAANSSAGRLQGSAARAGTARGQQRRTAAQNPPSCLRLPRHLGTVWCSLQLLSPASLHDAQRAGCTMLSNQSGPNGPPPPTCSVRLQR